MGLRSKWLALAALTLTSCYGYGYGYVEVGYVGCDPYYDDCYDDYYYYAWVPTSLAATDFDGDGRLDAVVSDGANGSVWFARGQEGGGFADPVAAPLTGHGARLGVAAVNVDGDLRPDLLVLDGTPGDLVPWGGDGHGGFTALAVTTQAAPTGPKVVRFAHGKLDADDLDDVVTLDEAGALHVALGTGTGAFVEVGVGDGVASFLGPDGVARLDGVFLALAAFDDRPGTDLVVLDGTRASLATFGGLGDGTFGPPRVVGTPPLDEVLDVAPVTLAAGKPPTLAVLSGRRLDVGAPTTLAVVRPTDGSYAVRPTAVGTARALHAADLDGDGRTDLLVTDTLNRAIRTLHAREGAAKASGAR